MNEQQYVRYRIAKGLFASIPFYLCRLFPIQRSKITVCTFEGKGGFGCNPKYIVEELHRRNADYKFVWLVNDMSKPFPDYVIKRRNTLWSRAFHLATSKLWIDNYRKPLGTKKRRGQFYIQTWHGTVGFKTVGLWRGDAFSEMAYLVSKNDSDMIDFVTIDSEWCKEMFPKGLVYNGLFLTLGAPRCDALWGDRTEKKRKFRDRFHLDGKTKLVMFAPTFREGKHKGVRNIYSETWTINFKRLVGALEKRFGGRWCVCVRVHPQLVEQTKELCTHSWIIDVSQDDDMYEILAAMDAFITDYSSAAMDASFANIPVFLYADDLDQYIESRGSFLWNMAARRSGKIKNNKAMTPNIDTVLPYSIAENNDELEKNILAFDEVRYQIDMEQFKKDIQLVFDGHASSKVADKIERIISRR